MSKTISIEGKRYYQECGEYFPSVTTILSELSSPYMKKGIENYYERLEKEWGNKKATRKKKLPLIIGSYIDLQLKKYLLENNDKYVRNNLGKHLLSWLNNNIKEVKAVDQALYHRNLKYAGTLDVFCKLKNGKNYVIDFKTSKKMKSRGSIKQYCLQCAAYGLMLESKGESVDGFIIPIIYKKEVGVKNPRRVDVFRYEKEELEEYEEKWLDCVLNYYEKDFFAF